MRPPWMDPMRLASHLFSFRLFSNSFNLSIFFCCYILFRMYAREILCPFHLFSFNFLYCNMGPPRSYIGPYGGWVGYCFFLGLRWIVNL